jgi:hypothetical protein
MRSASGGVRFVVIDQAMAHHEGGDAASRSKVAVLVVQGATGSGLRAVNLRDVRNEEFTTDFLKHHMW